MDTFIIFRVCVIMISLLVCGSFLMADAPERPTPVQSLQAEGFEATDEGIAAALASDNQWARIYALRVLKERNDPAFNEMIVPLLSASFIKEQYEAASLLTQFNRDEGNAWLQQWEQYDATPQTDSDTAHAILNAAALLAERGDERLAGKVSALLEHTHWAIKIHAARALADFQDTRNPVLENAWLKSADIAHDALNDAADNEKFVELYLTWLVSSLFQQSAITDAMTERFAKLASNQHPVVCRTIGVRLFDSGDNHGHDHSHDHHGHDHGHSHDDPDHNHQH